MIITSILVASALVALGLFFWIVLKDRRSESQLRAVDLEAFLNLMDADEERFLRENVPIGEFRKLRRERARVAVDYLWAVSQNAAELLKDALAARRSSDVRVAEAAQQLVNNASVLRVRTVAAIARLYVGTLLPGVPLNVASVADGYRQTRELRAQLGKLQGPVGTAILRKAV